MHGSATAGRPPCSGFTLNDLITALAIAGVITAFSIPALYDLVANSRLTVAVNTLMGDLHLARSEAIKRNSTVVVCRSHDGQDCLRGRGFRLDWSDGWIVFANPDDNNRRDEGEPLLRHTRLPAGVKLRFNQRWRVNYRGNGRAKNGTFTLCDNRGVARAVILYLTGRPRVARLTSGGEALRCDDA